MSTAPLILILSVVSIIITAAPAHGQFSASTSTSGQSFTSQEIANGKADHLNDMWQIQIISGSMLPDYKIGEYVTLNTTIPFESIQEGDVIVFSLDPEGKEELEQILQTTDTADMIMHRVIDIDFDEDDNDVEIMTVTTQGDNNDSVIENVEEDITKAQYVGKIVEEASVA